MENNCEMDIKDAIKVYFETFEKLLWPLCEMVHQIYNAKENFDIDITEDDICSDVLENEVDLFAIHADDIVERIIFERNYTRDEIKGYINIKYNNMLTRYMAYKDEFDILVSLRQPFHIRNVTVNRGYGRIFYTMFEDFFKKKTTSLKDYYDKILQELKTGYETIMSVFKNTEPQSNPDPDKKRITINVNYFSDNSNNTSYKDLMEAIDGKTTEISTTGTEKIDETTTKASIVIPDNILDWLAKTKCSNGKCFIESATKKPYKWLQSKQTARVFLTHEVIKDSLTIEEVKRQAFEMFIYKNNQPLALANNDNRLNNNTDTDLLKSFLDNIRDTTTCQTLK